MATIDAEGIKSFEAEQGKKLVLSIEDAGIDILHRCGGNARCTTCRVEVWTATPARWPIWNGNDSNAKSVLRRIFDCLAKFGSKVI